MLDTSAADSGTLQYLLNIIEVASVCAEGRCNIAEVGIQSAIDPALLLQTMLDNELPRVVHDRVARLYFEAVVEVEIPEEGLSKKGSDVWKWLQSFPGALKDAKDTLHSYAKNVEIADAVSARRKVKHTLECVVPALTRFLLVYYVESDAPQVWKTTLGECQGLLKDIQQLCKKSDQLGAIVETIELAYGVVTDCIASNLADDDEDMPPTPIIPRRDLRLLIETTAKQKAVPVLMHRHEQSQQQEQEQQEEKQRLGYRDSAEKTSGCLTLGGYVAELSRQPKTIAYKQSGMERLVKYAVEIPLCSQWLPKEQIRDLGIIRLEPLLGKLVRHTVGLIQTHGDRKLLLTEHVPSTVWLLRLFRQMIEEKWKFGVEERDRNGDEESDKSAFPIINALEDARAVQMCIDLIAKGLDKEVRWEATRLLVAMLFIEGGNRKAQQTMHMHFEESNSDKFFSMIREMLAQIVTAEENDSDAGEHAPKELWILTLLQLSCEGHYLHNQEVLREQPKNERTINLLDDLATHFQKLCNLAISAPAPAPVGLLETTTKFAQLILEVIQGPCTGNQTHFAQHTPLVETMNRAMRLSAGTAEERTKNVEKKQELAKAVEAVEELKWMILKIFKALLEGQQKPSPIYERVLSVLHLEVLQMQLQPPKSGFSTSEMEMAGTELEAEMAMLEQQEVEAAKPLRPVQVESLVLMEMLAGYNTNLKEEMRISDLVRTKLDSSVSSVEIRWHNTLHRRFFHIPSMCKSLSEATKQHLVYTVNRDNQDSKLTDFLEKTDDVSVFFATRTPPVVLQLLPHPPSPPLPPPLSSPSCVGLYRA
jgi:hypothetical protein